MGLDDREGFVGARHAARDRQVLGIGQGRVEGEHRLPGPLDQGRPRWPDEDQRRLLQVPHLEELPDHHHLQDCADAARGHDEGVGGDRELVQAQITQPT